MGEVENNFYLNTNVGVAPPVEGKSEVFLGAPLPAEDTMRFQNGRLTDSRGREFHIVNNVFLNSVVILNWPDGTVPEEGLIILEDDDAQVMPEMPKTGLLESAFQAAFVLPVIDGGGSLANNKSDLLFVLNVMNDEAVKAQVEAAGAFESKDNLANAYWIAYVQSAYQFGPLLDNDPDGEAPLVILGKHCTDWPSGSLVFLETLRDFAAQFPPLSLEQWNVLKQRAVAHEIAHGFVPDKSGGQPTLMHYPSKADFDNPGYSRFDDWQLDQIRSQGLDIPPRAGP